MSKIIASEPWSYTLYEDNDRWILTLLIGGVVDVPVSVVLNDNEINGIKKSKNNLEDLVVNIRDNREKYSSREIKPVFRG